MADTFTTNYSWTKPEVGASSTTWGTKLNADLDSIDTTVKAVSDVANAALPKAGGAMTGALDMGTAQLKGAVGTVALPGIALGDDDSGLYEVSDDEVAMSTAGVQRMLWKATGVINYVSPDLGELEIGTRRLKRVANVGGTLTADMVNTCQSTVSNITVPDAVFAAGDALAIYNRSGTPITLIAGSGITLRLNGTSTTGNLTIAGRGFATIWFDDASECVAMGAVAAA